MQVAKGPTATGGKKSLLFTIIRYYSLLFTCYY